MSTHDGTPVAEDATEPERRPLPEDGTPKEVATGWNPGRSRRPRRRRRPTSLVDKLLLGVGAVLVLLMAVGALGAHILTNQVLDDIQQVPDVFGAIDPDIRPQKPPGADETRNFLLVGVDSRAPGESSGTSDAVMVMHLAADRRSASIVSIPRDSWVPIPGRGMGKLSSAYRSGGGSLLVQSVEQLTRLRMDNFVVVDFAGFRDITDSVGGVDIRTDGETRTLDGDAALAYVRERPTRPGDLRPVEHQQQVMKALLAKVGSRSLLSSPTGTLKIADSVARSLSVDETLDRGDLRSLAFSLRSLKPDNVKFRTAPVRGVGRQGREAVVLLDARAGQEFWSGIARS